MSDKKEDRRRYDRKTHRGYGTLSTDNESFSIHLINLSMSGALVALLAPTDIERGQTITLTIDLENSPTASMTGTVAHIKAHFVGLAVEPKSDDDAAVIKEIIEKTDFSQLC